MLMAPLKMNRREIISKAYLFHSSSFSFCRGFSSQTPAEIQHRSLEIELVEKKKPKIPYSNLVFGKEFTDHMLSIEWTREKGWDAPKIHPYRHLSLLPSCVVFHYGVELFEGMKAYRSKKTNIHRLFRPDMNMQRMNVSARRLSLPSFDQAELLKCIESLITLEKDWIPNEKGYSLYIRPTMISTQESLGVGPSDKALLFVICSPVGPYYRSGFNPVTLLADPQYVRAWPGGTGSVKVGGNYGATIKALVEAQARGAQQVLWLFGKDHQITEVGTMNFFMIWINEQGKKELITPPLDGTILPGVTRDSILQLARQWKEFQVSERVFTMPQVCKALQENRVLEIFGAGTACIVSPVEKIIYNSQEWKIPCGNGKAGVFTEKFNDTILAIQNGEISHPWSVPLKDEIISTPSTN
eukprot:Sdes_comp19459_c0_seq1m10888